MKEDKRTLRSLTARGVVTSRGNLWGLGGLKIKSVFDPPILKFLVFPKYL